MSPFQAIMPQSGDLVNRHPPGGGDEVSRLRGCLVRWGERPGRIASLATVRHRVAGPLMSGPAGHGSLLQSESSVHGVPSSAPPLHNSWMQLPAP